MEHLKDYCLNICVIDGLQTYVISPAKYDAFIKDKELLKSLKRTEKDILPFIKVSKETGTDTIYLAFVECHAFVEKFQWIPVHCYKSGNHFYHVHCRNTWMCRECKNIINKPVIMPMVEADAVIYHGTEDKYPNIPSVFQKVKCPKCGKLLQNHLIVIE